MFYNYIENDKNEQFQYYEWMEHGKVHYGYYDPDILKNISPLLSLPKAPSKHYRGKLPNWLWNIRYQFKIALNSNFNSLYSSQRTFTPLI